MRVHWEVEDGYAGKSRPQYTEVPDSELEECTDKKEREELIEEYVRDDFEARITWAIVSTE